MTTLPMINPLLKIFVVAFYQLNDLVLKTMAKARSRSRLPEAFAMVLFLNSTERFSHPKVQCIIFLPYEQA